MSVIGKVARSALGVVGSLVLPKKPKAQPQVQTNPLPTRNAAAEAAKRSAVLARRRGSASTMVMGARGAEASNVGTKTQLGM